MLFWMLMYQLRTLKPLLQAAAELIRWAIYDPDYCNYLSPTLKSCSILFRAWSQSYIRKSHPLPSVRTSLHLALMILLFCRHYWTAACKTASPDSSAIYLYPEKQMKKEGVILISNIHNKKVEMPSFGFVPCPTPPVRILVVILGMRLPCSYLRV